MLSRVCGFVGSSGRVEGFSIGSALQSVAHRGPDERRILREDGIEIGFCRLAIRGVDDGMQPFVRSDDTHITVVNGEIYNSAVLRADLEAHGRVFQTESDCEVVHHGFAIWGNKIFQMLVGMFAAAIVTRKSKKVTLARDLLGKKPLYLSKTEGGVLFASEAKSLLLEEIELKHLIGYFLHDGLAPDTSVWSGVSPVPPGGIIEVTSEGISGSTFFVYPKVPSERVGKKEALTELEDLLLRATEDRLLADVPVGMFLSSGVDSLLVAGMASQASSNDLPCFTLHFEQESYDEHDLAKRNAHALGLSHHTVPASLEALANKVDVMIELFDEPVNDPAILGELLLAEFASRSTKVVLTGDGGDELFHGYQHIQAHRFVENPITRLLGLPSILAGLARFVPTSERYFSLGFVLDRFARGAEVKDFFHRDVAWRGAFRRDDVERMLSPGANRVTDVVEHSAMVARVESGRDSIGAWSWFYLRNYLYGVILPKIDRSTMQFGLEARSPLLDQRVVRHVLSCQGALADSIVLRKDSLRKILLSRFPDAKPRRKKHGMGVPVRDLLLGPLKPRFDSFVSEEFIEHQGILNFPAVHELVEEFAYGKKDRRKEAWGLFTFQAWWNEWVND